MSRQNVEDIYPLSPLQQGILFHTLLSPGAYTEQLAMDMRGPLHVEAFARAWQKAVDRHPALRTGFVWENVPNPLQVVYRQAKVPTEILDWRHLAAPEREARIETLLKDDRAAGFDMAKAPLLRIKLIRTGEKEHFFLLSFHHILIDGWSLPLVMMDMGAAYEAELTHQTVKAPPVRPYREYIAWLNRQDLAQAEGYWRRALAGVTAPTPLPLDRGAPGDVTEEHALEAVRLAGDLSERLDTFARANKLTVNTVVQGAWSLLLSRYAGEEDVVFGTTVSGRPADLPGVESMVGLFINTLPVRVSVPRDRAVLDFLAGLQEQQAELRQYEYARLTDVQGWSEMARDLPMFESLLVFENYPLGGSVENEPEEDALDIAPRQVLDRTNFAISFVVAPVGDIELRMTYDARRFDAATIRRLLAGVRTALEGFLAAPEGALGDVPLVPEEDRLRMAEWHAETARAYPPDVLVHQLFEARAAAHPEVPAVVHDGETVTYGELNERANRLAHRLRRLGVGPEAAVGVVMERDPDLVAAILAVLKAGGAYVPVDPAYPADRVGFILADAGAKVVLTQSRLADTLPAVDGAAVIAVDDAPEVEGEGAWDPEPVADPRNRAYVIYTSGSTGRPKGVEIAHANTSALLHWMGERFPLSAGERVLASTSVTFDVHVAELHYALAHGGTLVLVENALSLAEVGEGAGLVHAAMVPTAAAELARIGGVPGTLKRIVLGGEAVPSALGADLYALGVAEVHNGYGPTEDTTYSTTALLPRDGKRAPIGRPVGGSRGYVLDERLRPVPIGAPGELYLAGAGVSRGYLGRPGMTAERYLPDPESETPGARMYRTGDLVRRLPDGELEYLGRIDFQVKVRGFRIETGEVESVLAGHPAVGSAVVVAREDVAGDRRLVAYLVPSNGAVPPSSDLREWVRESLPEYMVPSAFVPLEAWPLTSSGKVDRRALPAPDASLLEHAGWVAPRSGVEEMLAGVWAELLRVDRVGAHDSFFELGGHSLLATQLVSRIREAFRVELPLRTVFEAGRLDTLAAAIEGALKGGAAGGVPDLEPRLLGAEAPLSFAQERLWLIDQLEPGGAAYNMAEATRLTGALDHGALERTFTEIVRRHAVLRTVYAERDGQPVQVIAEAAPLSIPVDDLTHLPAEERKAEARRIVDAAARAPFDLATGPVIRVRLIRLAEDDHVLVMTMHHIAADAWSIGVLVREMAVLYEAFSAGSPSPLAEPRLQYADYAAWQREWLSGAALDAEVGWWSDALAGAPPVLELPTDRPRPATQSYAGAEYEFSLPRALAEQASALSRKEGATLFMALLAAFQVVLSRWSGQRDLLVGTPIANRTRGEVEDLIGFFTNTLVIRGELGGEPTFRDLLLKARERLLGAYAHQDVPFEKLVDALHVERSLSHSPLFQVMFTLNNATQGEFALSGLTLDRFGRDVGTARFDLTLVLTEDEGELRGVVEYATDLFDRATMERLVGHFRAVLEQAAAAPETRVSAFSLLGEEEKRAVVHGWNATDVAYDGPATLAALFEAQAARTPDAVALSFRGEDLTYAQLNARANRLAHHLRALGVGPDSRVGVCIERSVDMAVAVLATVKAGGCYVALDPAYPEDRLRYMLDDSRAAVLLARAATAYRLPRTDAAFVRVDADREEIERRSPDDPQVAVDPENLGYVLYTSGSTGRPKGVALPQRALVNLVRWQTAKWAGEPPAATLQFASLSFDVSFQEIFATWSGGGTLVLVDDDTRRDADALLRYLAENGVERLFLPFAALQHLAEVAAERDLGGLKLREIVTAGEQLQSTPDLVRFVLSTGARLENQYGPTEAHVVSAYTLPAETEAWPLLPPIGAPIANDRLYVLDARFEPVPVSVPGELYLAGEGLARGYLDRPGLTAEKFVPSPFGPAGARMYRTGDRARWLPTGDVQYLGRADDQVKLRGFRIELGEIEAVLRQHPAVGDAAVVVRGEGGDKRLVAYVVAHQGQGADAAALKAHLKGRLPEFMVPSAVVPMETLPLTPSGKVDRRALPAPEAAGGGGGFVEPRTETERAVAAVWAEVLRNERVGVHDDFFDAGGHSLRAAQAMSRLRDAFGVDLPLRALFEAPTVAELAERIEAAGGRFREGGAPAITRAPRTAGLPLSFAQERLWLVDQLQPGSPAYNMPGALRIRGALDASALERALAEIVRRHEPLRTTFAVHGDRPVQVVHPAGAFALPLEDLTGTGDAEAREAEMLRRVDAEARTPFDLRTGPVIRARLLRLAEEEHVFLFTFHHITADGWSIGVFVGELTVLYDAFSRGLPSPLPELPAQYADFAVWQRRWLSGAALERQMAYWRDTLAGAPPLLELPADRPRPALESFRGASAVFGLVPELVDRLRAVARESDATLFMALLAGFQLLLSRWAGQDDVVVGSPIAGRTQTQVEGMIGLFINTLALRGDLSGDPSFAALLGRTREATLGAFAHQDLPFEKMVEELAPERSLSHHPVFQVVFSLQNTPQEGIDLGGVDLSFIETDSGTARMDLSLSLTETPDGGLYATVEYATDLFDAATVDRLFARYADLLDAAAARPSEPVSALAVAEGEERETVVRAWNRTATEYPRHATIHSLFAEVAAASPDAVALVYEGETTTYGELDRKANRLARVLQARGVEAGARVGLTVERSADSVAAMLAVLKAGASYVPLDASYPAERLRFMLDDSACAALVVRDAVPEALAGFGGAVVSLAADRDAIEGESGEALSVETSPEAEAYVMYTSGSTGRPKGVRTPHRGVVRLVRETNLADFGPDQVALHAASLAFDASTLEIYGALLNGGRLVVFPAHTPSVEELGAAIRENGVTLAWLSVGMFNRMIDERPEDLAGLAQLCTGGDAASIPHTRRALELLPGVRLINGYGPTENTSLTTRRVVRAEDAERASVPIGEPLSNTRVYIVDSKLRPVPVGVPGELVTAGDGVALGYVNRDDLTAEKFVTVDFGNGLTERVYRTGDRARWLDGGTVEFLGRVDTQVKVRGYRIEPGEVETVLASFDNVGKAVVIVREDVPGDKRLVAYVTPRDGVAPTADALREAARGALPEYMVPAAFVVIDEVPLTPNGKVDRRALPAPEWTREDTYLAPRTETESTLAAIFAEVLGVERAGIDDDFFHMGGHSLLATQVVSRIRQAFGVELPLRAVFEATTVRGLAGKIEGERPADAMTVAEAERKSGRIPLSFAQERMWFLDQLDPGSAVYNLPSPMRLKGALDVDALERALSDIVRRHEVLRTSFGLRDGAPVQVIAPPFRVRLEAVDLSHLSEEEREAEAARITAADLDAPFDLAAGPLFRAGLVRLAEDEHVLLVNFHHAITDGWSMGVFFRELLALYGAFSLQRPSPLPEPALQYADFAVWQRKWLDAARVAEQVAYWKETLAGAPAVLELPTDHPRPAVQTHAGASEWALFPRELVDGLHALSRREGATLAMTLLAAFQLLLGRLAGQDDVVVGTPIAGRTRAETEEMIGLFLNTLALRTRLDGDPTFSELVGRARETMLGAYAHQDVPFERLLEEVRPERSLAWSPVFQVMFNLLNFDAGGAVPEGLQITPVGGEHEYGAKFDLTLYLQETPHGMVVHALYNPDLFSAGRMEEMVRQLQAVLEQAVREPSRPVSTFTLLSDEARPALPDPAAPLPAEWFGPVHSAVSARAAEAPSRVALVDRDGEWTYAELESTANRIAHRLVSSGIAKGDVVAIHAHRSAPLVAAMLGVAKAGAAWTVLDPAYPPARLAERVLTALPRAWVRVAAAGPVAPELEALIGHLPFVAEIELPAGPNPASLADLPTDPPAVDVGPDDLAYLAFTSGTTGTAKAVMGTHRPLSHFFRWYVETFATTADDRWSMLSGLAHDPLLRDVFAPLVSGGTLVIPDAEEIGTPGYLAWWMAAQDVTVAHLTPAMGQLVASGEGDDGSPVLPALRLAFFGGDALTARDVRRVRSVAPNVRVVNFYGATETPQAMGWFEPQTEPEGAREALPVGRGIDGVQLLVLTPAGSLAGVGEVGEIAIRTPYLARGYLGDPALTGAKFVANPVTGDPADRVYRTGDLGRFRPDGTVDILGRADGQVQLRGFRVELGEVEAALAKHPSVRECVVVARDDARGERRLVAYAIPSSDAIDPAELRTFLRGALPDYMVPSAFVALGAIPLTANAKVDRRALPDPDEAAEGAREHVAPRDAAEETLAAIWAEVLGRQRVGVTDDFFALGGHSLLATQVVSRIRRAFGVEVPLRALFEAHTVAALARAIAAADASTRIPPLVPVGRDRALPLSFAQERLWFLDQMDPGSFVYNMPGAARMPFAVDAGVMERALGLIVARHESLRTTFAAGSEGPVQVIAPAGDFRLRVVDLTHLDLEAREAEALRLASEDAQVPFDLARGPLFRAKLVRIAEDDHMLLFAMHHAVSDGWSTGVFVRELNEAYGAFAEGREPGLPELPVQYADFAAWQREWLKDDELERQLAWWRRSLRGAPPVLELPTDRPRPPVQTFAGSHVSFVLPPALAERLSGLAREEGATLFMVLMGAFQLFLSRYAGQDDVVVGTPIAGRTRTEVEELIGFFANTLALRGDLSGDPSFRAHLRSVRETTLGAYAHQDVPFEKLVDALGVERNLSVSPLFQALFVLQNAPTLPGAEAEAPPAEAAAAPEAELGRAKFDLSLSMIEQGGALAGRLEFNTDLFERATAERMAAHFRTLLESVASSPGARVSTLPLVGADERAALVAASFGPAADAAPRGLTLHGAFAATVRRDPDAVALRFESEAVTFGALDAWSNRVARMLAERGVGLEDRVAVCTERSPAFFAAMLGAMKAGAAYLPLDPAYPADRLAYMLEDSGARAVLAQADFAGRFDGRETLVIPSSDEGDETAPAVAVDPENAAYVIYTSGSTGRPKGVVVPHRAIVNSVAEAVERYGIGAGDHLLQWASYSFDGSLMEIAAALISGASLRLAPRDELLPGPDLARKLAAWEVTWMVMVPSALAAMPAAELPKLRIVGIGGEALAPELVERWAPGRRMVDLYGPTEAAVWCAGGDVAPGEPVTIGTAVSNVRLHVLDPAGQPAPTGVPGELYVGGANVARGYLGRPALTAERFVPDPFSREPGARMYRTGDRVRRRADGRLEFVGRADEQVKVRGFRVEPGEIEAAVLALPGVREAAVVARPHASGDVRIVAYVVPADAVALDVDALRAALAAELPDYMVPAAFVAMDALPTLPNGKTDRRALPEPEWTAREAYTAPRTEAEARIAEIWRTILRVERVGIDDDFFSIGGHSLLATQVVSRIREAFAADLPLRALFEAPTVRKLAERLEGAAAAGEAAIHHSAMPPIRPVDRSRPLPLSFGQNRMWVVDQLDPGSDLFTMGVPLRLTGGLDVDALERAVGEVVRRHETLRTTFRETGDGPEQVVAPFAGFRLPADDLSGLGEAARDADFRLVSTQVLRGGYDLRKGPLFRARLVRMAPDDHVLLMGLHHAVSDGWSIDVLTREVTTLYAAFARGEPSPLPELPVQYADFAAAQRAWMRGEVLERQLAYWKGRFTPLPAVLELPSDRPRPPVQSHRGGHAALLLPRELTQRVEALARREGATLFMTLVAGFKLLLGRLAGTEDVVVGSPMVGRHRPELEGMIGLFLSTLALRTDLSGDPTFRELLHRVRETTLGAYAHQDLPFERLLEELEVERSLAHSPLFQVMFNLLTFGTAEAAAPLPGVTASSVDTGVETGAKVDMTVYARPTPDGVVLNLVYATDLFDAPRMEEMLEQYRLLLEQVTADPDLPTGSVSLLTDEARAALPDPTEPIEARGLGPVHAAVSARAAARPSSVALVDRDRSWTYGELESTSNRIAHHLIANGVAKGDVVALHAHRSAWTVAAMVGVAKAGAAWTVLDPTYPEARLVERVGVAKPRAAIHVALDGVELPAGVASALGTEVLTLGGDPAAHAALAGRSAEAPEVEVGPDDVAYLAFTSGTTGAAKAVVGTHGPLSHFFHWYGETFGPTPDDRWTMLSGLSHDPLVRDVFAPLATGGTLVVPDPAQVGAPGYLAEWMARERVTVAHLTPAMGQLLTGTAGETTLPDLRLAFFGGDVLSTRDVERLRALAPHVTVVNFYGATETPQAMAFHIVPTVSTGDGARTGLPVGRGIEGVQLLVLDPSGRLAGVGERGEVVIRTPYLARGYLGDEAATAEKFAANPFTGDPADRVYRTGDLGRYEPDGTVRLAGRADAQVQVRGFRVEPGEVEAALAAHPSVREAAVVPRETPAGDRVLVAYVVLADPVDGAGLRAHLASRVPEYMVPAAFVSVKALPLTPNGKLDRRALPDPAALALPEAEHVAPRTVVEQVLAEIWTEVLGRPRVGVLDSFFAIGGHSLLATQVLARVEQAFGVRLPLRTLFEQPTIAALAEALENSGQGVLADVEAELEGLSDEEIEALLAEAGEE
ncbi:MAG TPA: non-ribosomal peptide synthase/polyketide synthase [Longimicrobium sp.]|nr:non-ribosomal peptide synthase/polyketide synthase [Longimicrobium sp.]